MKGFQEVCRLWEFQANINNYNNLATKFGSTSRTDLSISPGSSQPDVYNHQYRSGSCADMNSNPTISCPENSGPGDSNHPGPPIQPCVNANFNQETSDSNTWTYFHFKTMERWASIGKKTRSTASKASTGVQTDDSSFERDFNAHRCRRHRLQSSISAEDVDSQKSGVTCDLKDLASSSHSTHGFASTCSKATAFMQFRRSGLHNVHFPKWSKLGKKPSQLSELTEAYMGRYYRPFSSVRKQITQQTRDILFTRFGGDYTLFEENYLKPLANCLKAIQDADENILPGYRRKCGGRSRNSNKKVNGWPLCTRGFVIVHLTHLDPTLLTQTGDFYIVAEDPPSVSVVYRDRGTLYRQTLDDPQFISFMAGLLSSEGTPPEDEEDDLEDSTSVEKELFHILSHLMVSSERGSVQRIELGQVAKDLWKFDGPVVRKSRHRFRSTRDSWVQTVASEELCVSSLEDDVTISSPQCSSESLAPLASEEEFCSDTEVKLQQSAVPSAKRDCLQPSPCLVDSCEDLSTSNLLAEPSSINDIADNVIMSKIAILPGCRDLYGRSVLFLSLEQTKKFPTVTPVQIAQLILYLQSVPKRDVMNLGFLIVVDGREAAIKECCFLEKMLTYVETAVPRTVSLVLTYQKQGQKPIVQPTSVLHRGHIRFEVITNVNQLLKYIRRNQLLPEYGGSYIYDHDEWIAYHKFLDPFVNGCRMTGRHLLTVMQDLRSHQLPPSSSLSSQMIEHHKKQIMEALEDEQLRHLEEEGNNVLEELETYHKKSPQNHDYRDSVEKCSLFYEQLKKILLRLTKLADKRLGRLQECMMLKTFEEESSQVLSWLCHKGSETLKQHKVLAENVSGIREQENEFEKFYFLAMRQIERGNDLLDDTPKPKVVSATGINGLASMLRSQLEEFTEKLEDARERLEDTSRCYKLLDKSYEWALETMRFVSRMKFDSSTSLESLVKILQQLDDYLKDHFPISEDSFRDMISLAQKLGNERLLEQCQVAKAKCSETTELINARLKTLRKAKDQMEVKISSKLSYSSSSIQSNPFVWMPIIASSPYRSPSQSFLHGPNALYGSQQIPREATGSYTSFPSSYYPASGLKDNRVTSRKEFFLKGSLVTEDLTNQPSLSILPNRTNINLPNLSTISRKSSYPWGSQVKASSASDGSKTNLNDCASIASSVQDLPSVSLISSARSWKMCEEALTKAAARVREQNDQLQLQQSVEGTLHEDDLLEDDVESDKVSQSQNGSFSKPAPVNMHLLRCASCSDFEELLSSKNAELEAQRKTKKLLKLIMREMIQTERDYVKSLEYIIENYVPLLQKTDIPQALRGQRNVLFGNIEKIYEFHNCYFLQELEQCENLPYSVGQCFLKYEPQFYLYALYNKNKPKSDNLLAEYGNSFCKQKQQELGDKMDLASYLLKPVQRMGKYALLLKQLLKECPEQDCDFSDLKAAEEMVHFQLRHGNDLLAMDALRDCDVNVKEQGRLLRQDEFLVWQGKSRKALRHVFLFEDLILFSKVRRNPECKGHDFYQYKNSIKTTDIGLTEQVGESPTKFEIWFRKRKVQDIYTLQAPSAEVKKAWVQDISKLLWKQALRNRELRLAEMSSMGIGNKPCLDISPNQDQICDRSISLQHLNKAPRFRNSIAITGCNNYNGKRPNSIISVSSNSSSGSSSSSAHPVVCVPTTLLETEENTNKRLSMAQRSQCSAESGIFTDASMSGDSFTEHDFQRGKAVMRSDSVLSQTSLTSVTAEFSPNAVDTAVRDQLSSAVLPSCREEA